ncbi:MAG: LuxR C-terminal-related transcriptional regulator, partial [Streptosporangiaceae bacterium]
LEVLVLDGVAELVDQSMLRQARSSAPSLPRYAMLETVREYAAERLDQLPEADRVRGAHAAFFLALVATGRPRAGGLATKEWLDRVDAEHNNIRTALAWYQDHDPSAALVLAASMAAFWSLRGHHTEGRQSLVRLLALVPGASVIRVSALNGAGWLALDQGDYAEASRLFAESIGLAQALGDMVGEGIATVYMGRCKLSSTQIAEAVPDVERATALISQAGDRPAIALTLFYSALVALITGRLEAACDLFARCAAEAAGLGLEPLTARARAMLSYPQLDLGDMAAARTALAEGIPLAADVGDRWFVQMGLGACIGLATGTGRPRLALRLAGAADAYRDANEFSLPVPMAETIDRWLGQARTSAGAAAGRLIAEGRRLSPEQAVELALDDDAEGARGLEPRRKLTRREAEVAALVARGLTNREIAARLFLSVRTVEVHVDHVLTKLGFHTRTQLAAWAHEEGLLPEGTEDT